MEFLITRKPPVMFISGGRAITPLPEKVDEQGFWYKAIELNSTVKERKEEMKTYLMQSNDHTVTIGDYIFQIRNQ